MPMRFFKDRNIKARCVECGWRYPLDECWRLGEKTWICKWCYNPERHDPNHKDPLDRINIDPDSARIT